MNKAAIIETVNNALAEEFELDIEKITTDALLRDDLGLDSLDAVDMIIVLEQAFAMKIGKDPSIAGIKTVGELYDYVLQKKAA